MSDFWSQYWQQGHITSFGHDIVGNYQGVLREYWESTFSLCDKQSRVLDIGTGNGALIDIALACRNDLNLTGVDYAQLNVPAHLQGKENVRFLEKVNAEQLPIEAEQYELVVSQFGIEYADMEKALAELARVLVGKGQFHLVMHDHQSIIVQPNVRILNAAEKLKMKAGVLDVLAELVESLERNGQASQLSEGLRHKLNTAIGEIIEEHREGLAGTLFPQFLRHIMSNAHSTEQRTSMLKQFYLELEGQIVRLSELRAAALDQDRYQRVLAILKDQHLTVTQDEIIKENSKPLARVISGYK